MQIIAKEILADILGTRITRFELLAPEIACKALVGQFVVLMVSPQGERIPLTIVDKDPQQGTVSIIVQEAGLTTKLLGKLNAGERLFALTGPLGQATEIKNYAKVILVAGGVGIAEIFPVARALKEAGNHITAILGARTKELLILEKELARVSDELYPATDDGSYGRKGFTTDVLKELLETRSAGCGLVYAVGPIPMMRRATQVSRDFAVKAIVSLNALMVDGTGMCGCCRVTVGNVVKFSCVDGPEFDAAQVNWDELSKRNQVYLAQEQHICKLNALG
jgi:ferredoxin--NADP+ reductase